MAPTGIYTRLKAYYTGEKEPIVPPISTTTAVALLVIYTVVYVLPFYLSSITRPSPNLSRDAPSVIRGRIRSVTMSCIACSIATFLILSSVEGGSPFKALHHMGYFPVGLLEAVKSVGLTAILFLGPLFEAGIVRGGWRDWIRLRGVDAVINGWMGWRNLVAGPITEEVLFRSAAVPLLLLSQTSNTTIIFLTPFVFGLAHVHHFYEFRITHPETPISASILRSVIQLSYTTLFGSYVTFLYMRTGSLLGVTLVHAFCNWQGLPRFWGRLVGEENAIEPDFGRGKRSEDERAPSNELNLAWTFAYYVLLLVGAVAWWTYLWPMTESVLVLTKF